MKRKTTLLVLLALLLLPMAYAVSTTTQVNFNIATLVGYTLTLPGESGVAATGPGAATTAIEFNTTTGTDTNVNAKVVGAGTIQSDGTPIFQFDNTGTVDINLSVVMSADPAACINMTGATTYAGADSGAQVSTTNVSVVNNYTPAAAAQDWYMKADFTACTQGDSGQRTLTSHGVQS